MLSLANSVSGSVLTGRTRALRMISVGSGAAYIMATCMGSLGGAAVAGSFLFVFTQGPPYMGTVSEYTTSGTLINGDVVSGLWGNVSLAGSCRNRAAQRAWH